LSAAEMEMVERPAARSSIKRRSSSAVQGLFLLGGTIASLLVSAT